MKKAIYLLLTCITSGLFTGCNTKSQTLSPITEVGTDSITLQKVPEMELWCSDVMDICDSCLIIADRCQSEKLYIYCLSDFKFIRNMGKSGQGPTDCLFPFFVKNDISTPNEFTISDASLGKCKKFKLNHNQKDSLIYLVKETAIHPEILGSTDMTQLANNYYGTQDQMQGLFFIHHLEQDTTEWIPYPNSIPELKEDELKTTKQSRITVNLKKKRIAAAMRFYNQLFIYDENGKQLKSKSFGDELIPKIVNQRIEPSSKIFFGRICSTEQYIYLILSNQTYRSTHTGDTPPSKIAIFDWELNHIRTLQTDQNVYNMLVDSLYKRILFFVSDAEKNSELYTYPWDEDSLKTTGKP